MEERGAGDQHDIQPLALLHSELCYASTRVRVKLAATVPPPGLYMYIHNVFTHTCVFVIDIYLMKCWIKVAKYANTLFFSSFLCGLSSATPEPTLKASSLQKKVLERREKEEQRHAFLSSLSAHDMPIPPLSQQRSECHSSHHHTALLSMLEAVFTPRLTQGRKTALLQVLYSAAIKPQRQAIEEGVCCLLSVNIGGCDTTSAVRPGAFLPSLFPFPLL